MSARHFPVGAPVHSAEAAGIRALVSALPSSCAVWSNIELASGRPGQTFEHDAVVIAPHAVFTVELKSWGGRIEGNRDRWTLADGARRQAPIGLIQHKARVLKGRLVAAHPDLDRVWVQGLVFLTPADADPRITSDYEELVTTRRDIVRAITDPGWMRHPPLISSRQRQLIARVLNDGRPPQQDDRAGDFQRLSRLPSTDEPCEIWLAKSLVDDARRILHVYRADGNDKAERKRRKNLALREATLHNRLLGAPNVLRYLSCQTTREDPERILLIFEDTTPFSPLSTWLSQQSPDREERLELLCQVTRALAWVHERKLVHRRLCPANILVRSPDDMRLCGFELARDLRGSAATLVGTALGRLDTLYAAPEVVQRSAATEKADLFSLGVILYELLADKPLFTSVDQLLRPFEVPEVDAPTGIRALLADLLQVDPDDRPADAAEVLQRLRAALVTVEAPREPGVGDLLLDRYALEEQIGRGATAITWRVRDTQLNQPIVLKVASAAHAALLNAEARVLKQVSHPHLVRLYDIHPGDPTVLSMQWIDGVTAGLWAGAGDPLSPDDFLHVARGLVGATRAVHEAGWLHRDIKPENILLEESTPPRPWLLDLGLVAPIRTEGDLAVGTVHYKDPLVYAEGRWSPSNDQYALCLVLYELLTGLHPFGSAAPDGGSEPVIDAEAFPDSWEPEKTTEVAALLRTALSPEREGRPTSLGALLDGLEKILVAPQVPLVAPTPAPAREMLPADVSADTLVEHLELNTRVAGALRRLGITRVDQLGGIDERRADRLPNVGAKTLRSLRQLKAEARARFGEVSVAPAPVASPFFAPLVGDERPLSTLGGAVTAHVRRQLEGQGIYTIGELCAESLSVLQAIPRVGGKKLERIRGALTRMAGGGGCPDSLPGYRDALAQESGVSLPVLAAIFGLDGENARSPAAAAKHLGVTRQRVSQVSDLSGLRKDGSVGSCLVRAAQELTPPVGFVPLEALGQSLGSLLGGTDAPGWARFAAVLLDPTGHVRDAVDRRLAVIPPWTEAQVVAVAAEIDRLTAEEAWPLDRLAARIWDGLVDEVGHHLARIEVDSVTLLTALLPLTSSRVSGDHVHESPVSAAQALEIAPGLVPPQGTADEIRSVLEQALGPLVPSGLTDALSAVGWQQDGELWIDPQRVVIARRPDAVQLDATVPRQRTDGDHPPVVDALAASIDRGGVRVVALPPATHHVVGPQISRWLAAQVGADRVGEIELDRVLVTALRDSGLWELVPFTEGQPDADWSWAHHELGAALDAAMASARPGRITVLRAPSLLGPLGMMHWLSGFYERARGGRFGLIVLAMPGGIYDNRVRLNERYNLPYTPDMAAVFLEAPAGADA